MQNCGLDVTIKDRPERVFLISDTAVPLLAGVDALDTVIGKTGVFAKDLYSEETNAALDKIPTLGGGGVDSSGHVQVSLEVLLGEQPDLVVGYLPEESGITRETLGQSGIPLILPPTECEDPDEVPRNPKLEDIYGQLELYGRVFNAQDEAATTVAELRERIAAVEQSTQGSTGRTAAALFVTQGGSAPTAYAARSMAQVQMEAVGLTNVFSDVDELGLVEANGDGFRDFPVRQMIVSAAPPLRRTFARRLPSSSSSTSSARISSARAAVSYPIPLVTLGVDLALIC